MALKMLAAYYSRGYDSRELFAGYKIEQDKTFKEHRELPCGKGFADVVFLPLPHTGKPALVVELKYDKSVSAAIQQIKNRHYTQALEDYAGESLLVGISYERDNPDNSNTCLAEKVTKA